MNRMGDIAAKIPYPAHIIIILIVAFGVFFNCLFNEFVWDDAITMENYLSTRDVKELPGIFISNLWNYHGPSNYYRPMIGNLYETGYLLWGRKPWGLHLVNILFHCAASVLIFLIISHLLRIMGTPVTESRVGALAGALLFATHPVHTESVAWVSGITDLSSSFFFLLSFLLYIQRSSDPKGKTVIRFILPAVFFLVACLFKEPAVTLPLILIAYDYAFRKSKPQENRIEHVRRYIPFLTAVAVYFILRFQSLHGMATGFVSHKELSLPEYVINVLPLVMDYLGKLLLPVNLNAFYSFHPVSSLLETRGMVSLLITAVLICFIFFTFRRNRPIFFSLVFIIVPLLPALYFRATGSTSFAERYLYLPSAGFVFLLVSLTPWATIWKSKQTLGVLMVFAVLIVSYSFGTINRNRTWENDYTLWADTVLKSPDAALPRNNLGKALMENGLTDQAIEQYLIALKLEPGSAGTYNNLGNAYIKKGWTDKAIEQYLTALKLEPDSAVTYNNMGNACFQKGLIDEAIKQYQLALKLSPDFVMARTNLGNAYDEKGWTDNAIKQYQISLRLKPDDASAHFNLGIAYERTGLNKEAIREFQAALYLKPDFAEARRKLEAIH